MRVHSIVVGAALVALCACNTDPGEGKPVATVSDPIAAAKEPNAAATPTPGTEPSAAPTPAPGVTPSTGTGTATYKFSDADSKIDFVAAKVTRKHDGKFGKFTGDVKVVDGDPTKSSVVVEIDTDSIETDEAKLTGHLKTPDFLDVQKYPKARFTSTAITPGGTGGATHTVRGNFELHGVTKSITFPATIHVQGDTATLKSEFVIDRKDFNLVYPGMPDDLIKDNVLMKLDIKSKKSS